MFIIKNNGYIDNKKKYLKIKKDVEKLIRTIGTEFFKTFPEYLAKKDDPQTIQEWHNFVNANWEHYLKKYQSTLEDYGMEVIFIN